MNQRRAVKQLDDGGETNGAGTPAASVRVAEKKERGAKALPSPAEKIARNFRDRLEGDGALAREFLLDEDEVVANEIEDLLSREQCDGLPPGLTISCVIAKRSPSLGLHRR